MQQNKAKEVIELMRLYDPDCQTLKFNAITEYNEILRGREI